MRSDDTRGPWEALWHYVVHLAGGNKKLLGLYGEYTLSAYFMDP